MKTYYLKIALLFLMFSFSYDAFAQTSRKGVKPAIIPEWVKRKVTKEQYEVWQKLAQCFPQLDFSILKWRNLDSCYVNKLYKDLAKAVETDDFKENKSNRFTIARADEPTYKSYSEVVTFSRVRQKAVVVYSSLDGYDAHVRLVFTYRKNPETKNVEVLKFEYQPFSISGLEVNFAPSPFCKLIYISSSDKFKGFLGGRLYFRDGMGNSFYDDVSLNFYVAF